MSLGVYFRLICLLVISVSWQAVAQDSGSDEQTQFQMEVSEEEFKDDQTSKEPVEPVSQPTTSIEKVEVTGSYVRRVDIEGPSPVVTFTQENFNQAGVNTVSDYLRENAMFTGSTDNGDRDGFFRFRGQHAGSTLVLINGMRVPKLGGPSRGFYSGVQDIPTNVIERVEVLKDGSSALYGADAMAGVMNFITKKDYDGAEFSTRITVPEINQGLEQNYTIAFGKNYAKGNWFASAQFVEQRGYTQKDGGNYLNPTENPVVGAGSSGTFKSNNNELNIGCPDPSVECEQDFRGVDYIRDPKQNIGTLLSGRYDVSSDVSVSFVGMYNRRQRMDLGRQSFTDFEFDRDQIGSAELKQQLGGGTDPVQLNGFSPLDQMGTQEIAVLQNSYSAQSKVEGYYLDTWKWDVSGSYAYSIEERDHRNSLFSTDVVQSAFAQGFNPLNTGSGVNIFDSARVRGVEAYEASQSTARFVTTGELLDLADVWGAGGPLSLAIGMEGQWETTSDVHDDILIFSDLNQDFEPNQSGQRSVNSVFAELVAYPVDSLEVQLAGRFDNYSDFGGTFNPKLSMGYRPSRQVLLRSSIGTNFIAPSVRNMIQRPEESFEQLRFCDPNVEGCEEQDLQAIRYRDPNLGPEEGVNYNFGTVIQPNKLWTFTIDQWNSERTNNIAHVSDWQYNDIYQALGAGAATDQTFTDMGVTFDRDANGNITNVRIPHVTNLGSRTIRGLDIDVNFNSPVRILGRVLNAGFNMSHTHMISYKTQRSPELPTEFRRDLEWKNTLAFNVGTQNHNYRLAARTLAGDTTNFAATRTHTEYDLNYNYDLPFLSAQLSVGVKNLLNSRPPVNRADTLVRFDRGFNSYAFQALGRRYYMGYSMTF